MHFRFIYLLNQDFPMSETYTYNISGKMPLTAADKQRLYRMRRDADPERRALYLQKRQETYKQELTRRKRKLVKDMTKREHRKMKKEWKQCKRASRSKHRDDLLTPPSTPNDGDADAGGEPVRSRYNDFFLTTCSVDLAEYFTWRGWGGGLTHP